MAEKCKNKAAINKDNDFEDWCFVCKDGGEIRMCDYPNCLKGYHPRCVGEKKSFLKSKEDWECPWHKCFRCCKSSDIRCYTCKRASCHNCLPATNILRVRELYGFCKDCLKLALLIEEKRERDSNGVHVDFTDRDTEEGLFMEYYKIIKKNEGFKLEDIYAAKKSVAAKKNYHSESDLEDSDQEKEHISDSSDTDEELKHRKRRKSSSRRKPTRSNKEEFIGWASSSLTEFLNAIGECTTEKRSQDDIAAIVHDYAKKNKLLRTVKRKVITCDAHLQSLFGKETINRSRLYNHLKDHFAKDINESKEDEVGHDMEGHFAEDRNKSKEDEVGHDLEDGIVAGTLNSRKRQRKMGMEKKTQEKEREKDVVPIESLFASIVVENVKLVYLKRSVLKEMLKEPQLFEEKVTGCFVRFKPSKSYQLIQVKGVKVVSTDEKETILLFTDEPKEIQVSSLSDDDFDENEFEVLKRKVVAGEIERPTVEYLQQKARSLHKDMINVMICKELRVLPHLIDRANEKGWRFQLAEHRERLKVLKSGTEHTRLLQNVPTVIPDVYEPAADYNSGGKKNYVQSNEGNQDKNKSEEIVQNGLDASPSEKGEPIAENPASTELQEGCAPEFDAEGIEEIEVTTEDESVGDDSPALGKANPEYEMWHFKAPDGERNESPLFILRQWFESTCTSSSSLYKSKFMVWKDGEREEDAIPLTEALSTTRGRR